MAGQIHIVKQGDTSASIARKYGFSDWRSIFEHADNSALSKNRSNPHILNPGDKVVIPEKTTGVESGSSGQKHQFRAKQGQLWLNIVLKDVSKQPLADVEYELELEGQTIKGTTDNTGRLGHQILPDTKKATLKVNGCQMLLQIGNLDPIDTEGGLQGRLKNLGYDTGSGEEKGNQRLREAVEEFQCEHGLAADGIVGPKTLAKLEKEHGC